MPKLERFYTERSLPFGLYPNLGDVGSAAGKSRVSLASAGIAVVADPCTEAFNTRPMKRAGGSSLQTCSEGRGK